MTTVTTIDLRPGQRVHVRRHIIRTVATVTRHTEPGWTHLWSVTYQEGRTASWSGGNTATADHEWTLADDDGLDDLQAAMEAAAAGWRDPLARVPFARSPGGCVHDGPTDPDAALAAWKARNR